MTAPQHSITAIPRYVNDAAFDLDRIKLERSRMPDGGDAHPVVIYRSGESRLDLDAPYPVPDAEGGSALFCARDYLKPDHGQKIWEPRRLRPMEVTRCRDVGGDSGKLIAFALAMGTSSRPLTDAAVEAHVDEHGLDEILAVGAAALSASEAPKASEKKR